MTPPDSFEQIGSRGFYRPVAVAGVNGDVFTNETDALAWLDARI